MEVYESIIQKYKMALSDTLLLNGPFNQKKKN